MPVWKYRSVEEMPPTPRYERGSAEHLRQWEALWARASALAGKRFRRGVFRYESLAACQRSTIEERSSP